MSQPEAAQGQGSISGMLSQMNLLGLGVLLAWLVLFHLLVDIWLLCVFTSLLVVLGGWLCSQFVLNSDNLLHVERFVSLEETPQTAEDEQKLDLEIQNTIRKIVRDFVWSWYSTVSSECEFEVEVHNAMYSMALELKRRAGLVDRRELTQRVLDLYGCHLQSYFRSLEVLEEQGDDEAECLWRVYSRVSSPHPALKSSATEVNQARAMVDLLLQVLVPAPHLETRTGRFVVGELITCNVLLPLISKLSDPDWLNMLIVGIFTNSAKPAPPPPETMPPLQEPPIQHEEPQQEVATPPCPLTFCIQPVTPNDMEADTPELAAYDIIDSEELYCPQILEEEEPQPYLRQYRRPGKSNPFYQENDSDLDSPLTDKRSSMESLLMIGPDEALADRFRDCATPTDVSSVVDLEDDLQSYPGLSENLSCPRVHLEHPESYRPHLGSSDPASSSSLSSLQELDRDRESVGTSDRELLLGVPEGVTVGGTLPSPQASFSFQPLSSPDGPIIIQNLRITGTITAMEHRGTSSHPYTLYTVKYETSMGCEPPAADSDQSVAYHTVNRRYSEFLNLQTRLEEKQELRKILKSVKGPKKVFPDLPFGNMDSDRVEARKGLLETFLKQLCSIPETANSEEMQEFLALNTDARIAFVKKPFIVSRIDKMVVNVIVDTLKTAFPRSELQSPTEDTDGETEGGRSTSDKKSRSRLKFSSKMAPVLNGSDIRSQVVYGVAGTRPVCGRQSLDHLEAFLREQERLAGRLGGAELGLEGQQDGPPVRGKAECCGCQQNSLKGATEQDTASETALADTALNIVCVLIRDQWSWLCSENFQKTLRLLFGTLINRWLDVGVANLLCTQYWVAYLRGLQEAIWPGGSLPAQPRPQRTPQQKVESKEEAHSCLMSLIPGLVSDILGEDKFKRSWNSVLESLQDPNINRHLVYSLRDILLEVLVPESSEEDFQKTLLHSLSKNHEKLPP
ncbi:sorting nexin-19 [Hypomesus transpacificus]|uniref:sorting nexin-19 n=1 Tax=Hypomesus transpacificus TaxID=137520 RepID=UPI001F0782EB|nr:sorting nexin-19 [Hypomesus transpacificus]XP_046891376.1 sorting nexin-19 [Hypomesus transpacificus]